jgi:hypothetical protein
MLDFRPPNKRRFTMSSAERLWLLGAVLAVCLPILWLVRANRTAPDTPRPTAHAPAGTRAAKNPTPLAPDLQIDPGQLEVIRDNTLERPEEREVFLRLLSILKRASAEQLDAASIGRITYAQLQRQPNQYRGKLVTIQGTVRRATTAPPPKNDLGIDRYYQLWIEPGDAPSWPIVVVCLDLPAGFPIGQQVSAEGEITGFFFKRWAYMAQDQLRTAPALLARTVRWERESGPVPQASARPGWDWASGLLVAAGTLAIGAWLVWRRRSEGSSAKPPVEQPDFSVLEDRDSHASDNPEAGPR